MLATVAKTQASKLSCSTACNQFQQGQRCFRIALHLLIKA